MNTKGWQLQPDELNSFGGLDFRFCGVRDLIKATRKRLLNYIETQYPSLAKKKDWGAMRERVERN